MPENPVQEVLIYQHATPTVIVCGIAIGILTGCAHYQLPEGRLDTPEVRGQTGKGRVEMLRIEPASLLTDTPSPATVDPETGEVGKPKVLRSQAHLSAGFSAGIGESWDAGVVLHPSAPFVARLKTQLSGEPESRADAGNFATALTGGGGILIGKSAGNSVFYWLADFAFLAGYRTGQRHLFSLAPSITLASLSGPTFDSAIGATSGASGDSASATSMGAALGYQYLREGLILRAEISWKTGSLGLASLGGIGIASSFVLTF